MRRSRSSEIDLIGDSSPTRSGGHGRTFGIGMATGAAIMFFFSGLIIKLVVLAALVTIGLGIARRL